MPCIDVMGTYVNGIKGNETDPDEPAGWEVTKIIATGTNEDITDAVDLVYIQQLINDGDY